MPMRGWVAMDKKKRAGWIWGDEARSVKVQAWRTAGGRREEEGEGSDLDALQLLTRRSHRVPCLTSGPISR